jgi:hypothetical protein
MCICYAGIQSTGSGQEMGQDSAVGIVIRYGLDGPGIETWWGGADFLYLPRLALGPTQPPVKWVPGFFPRGKAAGTWS